MISRTNLDEILKALDRQIMVYGGSEINLVVCGGAALLTLGLINRVTKDVDVLGCLIGNSVHFIRKFPDWLVRAAEKVARDYGLPEGWLNLGPAAQVKTGLPEGLTKRLIPKSYGDHLTIYYISYISRLDQIFFKLYAAVDRDDYHVQDLLILNPTPDEIREAAQWLLTQDTSMEFQDVLKDFLKKHGYPDVAQEI